MAERICWYKVAYSLHLSYTVTVLTRDQRDCTVVKLVLGVPKRIHSDPFWCLRLNWSRNFARCIVLRTPEVLREMDRSSISIAPFMTFFTLYDPRRRSGLNT